MKLPLSLLAFLVACAAPTEDTSKPVPEVDADADGWDVDYDCDDESASVHPNAEELCNGLDDDCDGEVDEAVMSEWYADADGDGFGAGAAFLACEPPEGAVANADDCDDTDPRFHPGAAETDCTDVADYDCDGRIAYADADADGFAACEDCDDADAAVNPAAVELCNGRDDDCDGSLDEPDAADASAWYADTDGDRFGDAANTLASCDQPDGYLADDTDCDDADAAVNPAATELCNGLDDDCDGSLDEPDAADALVWYADTDGDRFGDATNTIASCDSPAGYVADDSDCDDAVAAVNPAATELCNGVDDDCDGGTDEPDAADASAWYADGDGDGFGDAGVAVTACDAPLGYLADATDCDDAVATVNPGATELCNGLDDDCDGGTDEPGAADASAWYVDADGDGFGDPSSSTVACDAPAGYVADDADCDDADAAVSPVASEICNGVDDDCDGAVDETGGSSIWYADSDGDGLGDPLTSATACDAPAGYVADDNDCDDTDPLEPGYVTVVVQGTDSVCTSTGTASVWADDRVRAYTSSTYDVAGWVKFDLSGIDPSAVVDEAWLNLHGENAYGSPANGPALIVWQSSVDGWTRSTTTATTISRDDLVSATTYTSFTATGWNSFEIDVAAWDWATDLADGWVTLGIDNPRSYYSYVYFNGTDSAAVRPELELSYYGCD